MAPSVGGGVIENENWKPPKEGIRSPRSQPVWAVKWLPLLHLSKKNTWSFFPAFTISWSFLNSCPLSQWCYPTISSSVAQFFSCPQSFPASGSFQMSRLFTSDGQRIGASASASVLPVNIQGWFPLGLTGLISLQSKRLSKSSPAPQCENINSLVLILLNGPTLTSIHGYWKNHSFDYTDLCRQNDVSY